MTQSKEHTPLPKHGGPNDWQEARRGLIRRKKKLNQRNQQIRDLKFRNERLLRENKRLREALELAPNRHVFKEGKHIKVGCYGCLREKALNAKSGDRHE